MIVMEPRYQFRFCCFCFSRYTRSDVLYSNLEIFIHTSSTHSIDDFPFNLFFQPVHWRKISHDRGSKARNWGICLSVEPVSEISPSNEYGSNLVHSRRPCPNELRIERLRLSRPRPSEIVDPFERSDMVRAQWNRMRVRWVHFGYVICANGFDGTIAGFWGFEGPAMAAVGGRMDQRRGSNSEDCSPISSPFSISRSTMMSLRTFIT